jgi:hypothetical protein
MRRVIVKISDLRYLFEKRRRTSSNQPPVKPVSVVVTLERKLAFTPSSGITVENNGARREDSNVLMISTVIHLRYFTTLCLYLIMYDLI